MVEEFSGSLPVWERFKKGVELAERNDTTLREVADALARLELRVRYIEKQLGIEGS